MEKKFYYNYEDAKKEAQLFAQANNGTCIDSSTDDRQMQDADYDDLSANLSWSGEVGCFNVEDGNGDVIGIFAYWD